MGNFFFRCHNTLPQTPDLGDEQDVTLQLFMETRDLNISVPAETHIFAVGAFCPVLTN